VLCLEWRFSGTERIRASTVIHFRRCEPVDTPQVFSTQMFTSYWGELRGYRIFGDRKIQQNRTWRRAKTTRLDTKSRLALQLRHVGADRRE
jgi:hypothetical protein